MGSPLLSRLDARDRALFSRLALSARECSQLRRRLWVAITHCGGSTVTVSAALAPLSARSSTLREAAARAVVGLALSHLVVQLVKRRVSRPRPSRTLSTEALVAEPPCFSFPSGHATAVMSVAFVYATAVPSLAAPLMALSVAVGCSRVRLGVHYPGDVIAGQLIALMSDVAILGVWSALT